jgi:hypothetical protein
MRGDQPYLNPIGINIPEFKKLWDADKSEDKSQYAKELAYIYHMCEYDSPYYDLEDKQEKVIKDFIGKTSWRIPKRVTNCIEAYKGLDTASEKRSLDAAVVACDAVAADLEQVRNESKALQNLLEEIDREIAGAEDVYARMELMKEKLFLQKEKMIISKTITDVFPKLEKTVESLINLRKKVTKAVYKGESAGAHTAKKFLLDDLMEELDYEQTDDRE